MKEGELTENLQVRRLRAGQNTNKREKEFEKQWPCVLLWVNASRCPRTPGFYQTGEKSIVGRIITGGTRGCWNHQASHVMLRTIRLLCEALAPSLWWSSGWKWNYMDIEGKLCALLSVEKGTILRKWLSIDLEVCDSRCQAEGSQGCQWSLLPPALKSTPPECTSHRIP